MNEIKKSKLKSPAAARLFALCAFFSVLLLTACSRADIVVRPDKYRNYYEIFVGGFYDSDGDGMGDLNGVTDRLDYLNGTENSLGIDGIWLMPVMPSPTYHKYDATDYMSIDPSYGTQEDFDRLIEECNKRGIAVIIDLMLNHTSVSHPWFLSASKSIGIPDCGAEVCTVTELCARHNPYCGYYHFSDDNVMLPGYYKLGNGRQYQAVFWDGMPDLNLADDNLRQEILSIAKFWLDKGVAGFRLDAVIHFFDENTEQNIEFLNWFSKETSGIKPDIYLVGEAWTDASVITRYYESGIDSFFNFQFSQQSGELVKAVRSGDGAGLAKKIAEWNARIKTANPSAIDAPFLSNHDNARSAGFLMNDLSLQKICAALYLFMPGTPFIYYGEEIGMTGSGNDENKRQPMLWSVKNDTGRPNPPAGADQTQKLNAGFMEQLEDDQSLLRFYMKAIDLKNAHPEIARGIPSSILAEHRALAAYRCDYEGKTVYVVHNISRETVTWQMPEDEMGSAKLAGFISADGNAVTQDRANVSMPPYSSGVWR